MVRYAHPGKPCDLIDASSVSTAGSSVPGNSEADRGLFMCVPRYGQNASVYQLNWL